MSKVRSSLEQKNRLDHMEVVEVDQVVDDIVESEDMEDVPDELLLMEDVLDEVVDDIVQVQVDHRVATEEDHHPNEDHLEADTRGVQVDHRGVDIVVVLVVAQDIRVGHHHEIAEDTLVVALLEVDHPVVEVDIVELPEVDREGVIRKIDHLVRAKDDTVTIVIAMVDHLAVKHSKKRRKPLFFSFILCEISVQERIFRERNLSSFPGMHLSC
jgi:hypothetical protein